MGQVETLARRWMAFYQEEGLGTGLERSRLDQLKKAWSTCRRSAFGGMCSNVLGAADGGTGQGDEEEDYLWCAVNLLLDEEEVARQLCPQCREAAERARCPVCGRETGEMVREENPTFDWARFQALKEGACD
ncbi:MAG: hypothetical protein ACLT9P_05995 [Evtepia gabavorous]